MAQAPRPRPCPCPCPCHVQLYYTRTASTPSDIVCVCSANKHTLAVAHLARTPEHPHTQTLAKTMLINFRFMSIWLLITELNLNAALAHTNMCAHRVRVCVSGDLRVWVWVCSLFIQHA